MIRWISVDEKLPKLYQEVLVRDGTHITTGYLKNLGDEIIWEVPRFDMFLGFSVENIMDWKEI